MPANGPTLGERIRVARERARLSQRELADLVDASERAVGDWENDRRKPRNRLGALEDVLGVSLRGEPEKPALLNPEELESLRAHIIEVLGEGSALESALDAVMRGEPSPRQRAGDGAGAPGPQEYRPPVRQP